eukprot:2255577-Rhodomonas_salina.1
MRDRKSRGVVFGLRDQGCTERRRTVKGCVLSESSARACSTLQVTDISDVMRIGGRAHHGRQGRMVRAGRGAISLPFLHPPTPPTSSTSLNPPPVLLLSLPPLPHPSRIAFFCPWVDRDFSLTENASGAGPEPAEPRRAGGLGGGGDSGGRRPGIVLCREPVVAFPLCYR